MGLDRIDYIRSRSRETKIFYYCILYFRILELTVRTKYEILKQTPENYMYLKAIYKFPLQLVAKFIIVMFVSVVMDE